MKSAHLPALSMRLSTPKTAALNALNNGRVQKRVRAALRQAGRPMSTSELLRHTHLRRSIEWWPPDRDNARRSILRVAGRYCERIGRVGRSHAILWQLKPDYLG
jgi:hypothetical protein